MSVVMVAVNVHLKKGLELAKNNKFERAEIEFNVLLKADPNNILGTYYRGCTRFHLNKFQQAIEDFNTAISSSKLSSEHEIYALYKCGFAYHQLHQYNLALDNYKQFLNRAKAKNKNDVIHRAYFFIGTIYALLNQNEEAVNQFDEAIQNSTGTREDAEKLYYLHRGRAHAFCTNFNDARNDLNIVIQKSSSPFLQGCAYNELGQHQKALKAFDSCVNNGSSSVQKILEDHARFRRGLSYASLNFHDKAIDEYQHILGDSPEQDSSTIADRIFFRKGMSYMKLNDVYDAIINFNKSISLNKHQSDVFYARGMLNYTLGQYAAAVHDHRRALELGELGPSMPSISYTHNYYQDDSNPRNFNEKQSHEPALKYNEKHKLPIEEKHERIAESRQQSAPYPDDPAKNHDLARENIEIALHCSSSRKVYYSLTLGIPKLYKAQILSKQYPNGVSSEGIVNQFIEMAMGGSLEISNILQKCALNNDWNTILEAMRGLKDIPQCSWIAEFKYFHSCFIQDELKKANMIKDTGQQFQESPSQYEFYTRLVIRLCNLFDATRVAAAGIFQHALTGKFSKVAFVAKLFGYLSSFLPMGSTAVGCVFTQCESAANYIDETRIQNALASVGKLDKKEKLDEAANIIAEKLTIMYEEQIKRFPSEIEEQIMIKHDTEKKPNCCVKCSRWCCDCFNKSKNRILNDRELSTIENIVQYAFDTFIVSLETLDSSKLKKLDDLVKYFIDAICDAADWRKIYRYFVRTKIQPKDAKNDSDHWDTYEFFRGPCVKFEENDIRTRKNMNKDKYGFRGPSLNEEFWHKNDPEKLDELGFKNV